MQTQCKKDKLQELLQKGDARSGQIALHMQMSNVLVRSTVGADQCMIYPDGNMEVDSESINVLIPLNEMKITYLESEESCFLEREDLQIYIDFLF